ncbi:MAG: VTT domain-containing protein, partial [Chloroflexi bacterium]|nr:VTT domain-containing protein [Chloroflexota bacterium]
FKPCNVRLTPERLAYAEGRLHQNGFMAVVIGRLIPGLRNPTSLASGTLRLPYEVFLPATLVSALIWSVFYFSAGVLLGHVYDQVDELLYAALESAPLPFIVVGAAAAAGLAAWGAKRLWSWLVVTE